MIGNFVRPPGHQEGDPIVNVSDSVIRRIGLPEVNYTKLSELFYNELYIPEDCPPKVNIFGKHTSTPLLGFNVSLTRSIFLQAIAIKEKLGLEEIHRVLAHEGQHVADGVNNPGREIAESAGRLVLLGAAGVGSLYLSRYAPKEIVLPAVALSTMYLYRKYGHHIDPAEQRAIAVHTDETLMSGYRDLIVFPESVK